MIKYFKLRKMKLLLETIIISKIYSLIENIPDLTDFLQKAKDIDGEELQNLIAKELAVYVKSKEENKGE